MDEVNFGLIIFLLVYFTCLQYLSPGIGLSSYGGEISFYPIPIQILYYVLNEGVAVSEMHDIMAKKAFGLDIDISGYYMSVPEMVESCRFEGNDCMQ